MVSDSATGFGPTTIGFSGPQNGADYERWIEEICRGLVKCDARPLTEGSVRSVMSVAALPRVSVALYDGTAVQFVAQADDAPRMFLQLPIRTEMRIERGQRSLDIGSCDLGLTDAADIGANTVVKAAGRFRSIGIDRQALLEICPNAEDLVARAIPAPPKFVEYIHCYHEVALRTASGLDAAAQRLVARHLVDLVSLALQAGGDATEFAKRRGLAAARLAAIKADIARNLTDPDLSVTGVASRHHITPRYVHMLFEGQGITFTGYVIAERLARACRMLADHRFASKSISAIALGAGFGDLSYFNRCFRRRYGMTPSDIREQGRRPG
jgi:AraC-like DNA-binding protein